MSAKVAVAKEYDGRFRGFASERIVHGKDQIDLLTPKGLGLSLESRIGTSLRAGVCMIIEDVATAEMGFDVIEIVGIVHRPAMMVCKVSLVVFELEIGLVLGVDVRINTSTRIKG